jgi:hypothetical protein
MAIIGKSVFIGKSAKKSMDKSMDKVESLMIINTYCSAKEVAELAKIALEMKIFKR